MSDGTKPLQLLNWLWPLNNAVSILWCFLTLRPQHKGARLVVPVREFKQFSNQKYSSCARFFFSLQISVLSLCSSSSLSWKIVLSLTAYFQVVSWLCPISSMRKGVSSASLYCNKWTSPRLYWVNAKNAIRGMNAQLCGNVTGQCQVYWLLTFFPK